MPGDLHSMPSQADNLDVMVARIEGKLDTLTATVDGQVRELRVAMTAGDSASQTLATGAMESATRAHARIDDITTDVKEEFAVRDKNISDNRKLIFQVIVAPILVAVLIAILALLVSQIGKAPLYG